MYEMRSFQAGKYLADAKPHADNLKCNYNFHIWVHYVIRTCTNATCSYIKNVNLHAVKRSYSTYISLSSCSAICVCALG